MLSVNLGLVLIGLGKVAFGLVVGVLGIFFASRALGRILHGGSIDVAIREGNTAIAILNAASLVALGLLAQHAVGATFDAMDLLYHGRNLDAAAVGRFAGYAVVHVGLAMGVGSAALALGAWFFGLLTREVDEIAEVKKNNVSAALVLGAVLIVLSLMTAPGLSTALDGLLPLPPLGPGEVISPS